MTSPLRRDARMRRSARRDYDRQAITPDDYDNKEALAMTAPPTPPQPDPNPKPDDEPQVPEEPEDEGDELPTPEPKPGA